MKNFLVKMVFDQEIMEGWIRVVAVTIDVKRTGFYQELSDDKRAEYLGLKRSKFIPTIDNLYYSVFVHRDGKEETRLERFLERLDSKKSEVVAAHQDIDFGYGLMMTVKSYHFYRFCLSEPDLYDIFICSTLPNDGTPRIVVQLRAFGLWTRGVEDMLTASFKKVTDILDDYSCAVEKCRENRIDYCYHTNAISSPDKIFKETRGRVKYLHTNLEAATYHADLEHVADGTVLHKDYVCFGKKESNNVRARVYDKVKEVMEKGYKDFFFKIWHDNELISYYDKWCMEYAFPYKNADYLNNARVAFYVEHGTDNERRQKYAKALASENTTLDDFKKLANEFMPKTTAVINIEYETKRKFYYYSDDFIDAFKCNPRSIPKPLERLYKILDNKGLFLGYLTSKTLSFHTAPDASGEYKYVGWWKVLRECKLGGIKADEKLLRDYSHEMDKKCVQKRAIYAIAAAAVYEDNVETGFVEDLSDFLADISDNQAHKMGMRFVANDGGEIVEDVYGGMLLYYRTVKAAKEKLLKNRKKYREEARTDEKV